MINRLTINIRVEPDRGYSGHQTFSDTGSRSQRWDGASNVSAGPTGLHKSRFMVFNQKAVTDLTDERSMDSEKDAIEPEDVRLQV
jgi:hypothetical protein